MKIETKFGTFECTVEEFKELVGEESVLDVRTHVFLKEEEEEWKVLHREFMKRREEEKQLASSPSEREYAKTPEGIVIKRVFINPHYIWVDTLGEAHNISDSELETLPNVVVEGRFREYKDTGKLLKLEVELEVDTEEAKYFIVTEDIKNLFNKVVLDKGTILKKLDECSYMDTLGKVYRGSIEEDLKDISSQLHMEFLFDVAVNEGDRLVLAHLVY